MSSSAAPVPDGLVTHSPDKCVGQHCCIHNPSPHHMVAWPMRWRADTGRMERICEHGVGHPDPDDAAYWERLGQGFRNIHGCDGCCHRAEAEHARSKAESKGGGNHERSVASAGSVANYSAVPNSCTLTDAERVAIQWVVGDALSVDGVSIQATLRGLLERLK